MDLGFGLGIGIRISDWNGIWNFTDQKLYLSFTLISLVVGQDFLWEPGNLVPRKSFVLQEIGIKFLQF